jgi:hypothetical protein
MTFASTRTRTLVKTSTAIGMLIAVGSAHAQFGGLFQSMINSAVQQGAQQAATNAATAAVTGQVAAPQIQAPVSNLTAQQVNAIGMAATAIPANDPEYQAMLLQGLANVPAAQRNTMAPIIDLQVRQTLAARRMGYTLPAGGLSQMATGYNPVANAAAQNALAQTLAGQGVNPAALGSDAGKAVAAGAILQGLGSLFSRPAAPETPAPATQP